MIEPIGASLLLSGTSLGQSGVRRQPVLWRSPDPWSSPDISTFEAISPQPQTKNHIRHFHIFIRNTEISLKFLSRIAIIFYGALSLVPSNPSF
jgi:hypothetical protein